MPLGVKTDEEKEVLAKLLSTARELHKAGRLDELSSEARRAELDQTIANAKLLRIQTHKKLKGLTA